MFLPAGIHKITFVGPLLCVEKETALHSRFTQIRSSRVSKLREQLPNNEPSRYTVRVSILAYPESSIAGFIRILFSDHPSTYAAPETASPRTNTATAKMTAATSPTSRDIAPVSLSTWNISLDP